MTKNNLRNSTPKPRQSQREYMLSQREQGQFRTLRLALFGLIGFIAIILLFGLVWEFLIKPQQPVAVVNDTDISQSEWYDRTTFERNRILSNLDDFYDAVGGDLNQLYQFAGNQLQLAQLPAALGRQTLDQMIDDVELGQEAARRSITISDEEVDTTIKTQFNFYDGDLPTATPEPTQTIVPTPSITPIVPLGQETEEPEIAEDTNASPTEEPTALPTALPTATPVSQESYSEQYGELITNYEEWGGNEEDYRREVRSGLLREKLGDAFAEDSELELERENYSLFTMIFQSEEDALIASDRIEREGFVTAWNTIRSIPREESTQPYASEIQWTSLETISNSFGIEVNNFLLTADIDDTSDILIEGEDSSQRWFIINLRGREVQPVNEAGIEQQKVQRLNEWLTDQRQSTIIYESRYIEGSPSRPVLGRKFFNSGQASQPEEVITP